MKGVTKRWGKWIATARGRDGRPANLGIFDTKHAAEAAILAFIGYKPPPAKGDWLVVPRPKV